MSFISELIPSRLWVETYLVQPFEEGSERLGRAYHGEYPFYVEKGSNPIPWKNRFRLGAYGLALSIPLINTVVWIFMQTFLGEKPTQRDPSHRSERAWSHLPESSSGRAFGRSSGIVFGDPRELDGRSGPSSESGHQ